MNDNKSLVERLRTWIESVRGMADQPFVRLTVREAEEAADLIERQSRRICELECARIAYASEFAPNADGEPDVGNIHANIRAMKAKATLLEQIIDIYDDGMNNAPEHRCYVEGAWSEVMGEARAAIAASEPKKEPT